MEFSKNIDTMAEIHREIQGLAPSITLGLHPQLETFIGTAYTSNPQKRLRYVAAMRREAVRQGLELPPSD